MVDKVPIGEQIAAAERAHEQRSEQWLVSKGGMTVAEAFEERKRLGAVVATLKWLRDNPTKVKR